jgi:hypothetical protein
MNIRCFAIACILLLLPRIANAHDGYDYEKDYLPDTVYVPVHDTTYIYISNLNDITTKLGVSYDSYVKWFLYFAAKRDSGHLFSPQEIYLNYFLPLLEEQPGSPGHKWIQGVFSLYASPDTSFMKYNPVPLPDTFQPSNQPINIVFECRGDKNTDYFLQSPQLIDTYLVQLFRHIHEVNTKETGKIHGVNFYFPDFSFNKKRAMAQFAKSISLVTDSCRLNTIRTLNVYFSFNKKKADNNHEYLSCIADMTDSIFVFNNQANPLFSSVEVITRADADKYSLISKVINQIYLASFYMDYFPATSMFQFQADDIIRLIHADYPENNWETYAFVLASIFLLVLVIVILYFAVPGFAWRLSRSKKHLTILVLMLLFETFLLLFSMVEVMSRSSVFDFSNKNKNLLLFMPLLLVFIAPVLRLLRNKEKP